MQVDQAGKGLCMEHFEEPNEVQSEELPSIPIPILEFSPQPYSSSDPESILEVCLRIVNLSIICR